MHTCIQQSMKLFYLQVIHVLENYARALSPPPPPCTTCIKNSNDLALLQNQDSQTSNTFFFSSLKNQLLSRAERPQI